MTLSFEIPRDIEQELHTSGIDLSREAKEAFFVGLYRQERITHHQLAQALGLSSLEADGVLKQHKVPSGPATVEECGPNRSGMAAAERLLNLAA